MVSVTLSTTLLRLKIVMLRLGTSFISNYPKKIARIPIRETISCEVRKPKYVPLNREELKNRKKS